MTYFLIILSIVFTPMHPDSEEELLQRGLDLEADGQYEQALEVWSTAFTELETPSLAIGREFIRLTTEQNIRPQYKLASNIYLWGLSAETVDANRRALKQELDMLEPMVDRPVYREWEKLLEENDPALYRHLRGFWQQLNPTPGALYNERLLEHWERIAHAREHYSKRDDPPYGTDDRGPVYIRYGPPDRQTDGFLRAQRGKVYSACGSLPGCNPETMANIVMDLHTQPYYEIWIYNRPSDEMKYNLVMIFGDHPSGGFGRIQTIEDFIPSRAFSTSKRFTFQALEGANSSPGELFTPGMIMQWLYYQQLAATDFFFANRFNELVFEWDREPGDPRLGRHQGPIQEERSKMITLENIREAPPEKSTHEEALPSIPLRVYPYRMLDNRNRPITAVFLESQPREAFLRDLALNEEVLFPHDSVTAETGFSYYELTHGLQVLDDNGEILVGNRQPADLILDFQEDLPSSTVFTVPYADQQQQVILYAELHNTHPDSELGIDSPFASSLRGLGKLENSLPEPLSTDPGTLEMADLILGYEMQDDTASGVLFPFVVANNGEIPEGEELAVHLEVYNLQPAQNETATFQVEYEIDPVRRMEWIRGGESEFSLTLDMETSGSRFVENLEIRTRDLKPGRYELLVKATDKTTGQQVERTIEFEVVEKSESEDSD